MLSGSWQNNTLPFKHWELTVKHLFTTLSARYPETEWSINMSHKKQTLGVIHESWYQCVTYGWKKSNVMMYLSCSSDTRFLKPSDSVCMASHRSGGRKMPFFFRRACKNSQDIVRLLPNPYMLIDGYHRCNTQSQYQSSMKHMINGHLFWGHFWGKYNITKRQ